MTPGSNEYPRIRPENPRLGDAYVNPNNWRLYVFTALGWRPA